LFDNIAVTMTNIPAQLREYASGRVKAALMAFAGRFDSVRLFMSGDAREQVRVVKCQIKVRLVPSGIWLIQESRDADPYVAIERASEALLRSFERYLTRLNTGRILSTAA